MSYDSNSLVCSYCDDFLSSDEEESPYYDEHGAVMCDYCHTEQYEFTCGLCGESHKKYPSTGDIGSDIFALFEKVDDYLPGIFKILKWPFMMGALIGSTHFVPGAIERLADLPVDTVRDRQYPCEPVCKKCQKKHCRTARKRVRK